MSECRRGNRCDKHNRNCGICAIQKGFEDVQKAIAEFKKGVNEAEKCEFCECVADVEQGLLDLHCGVVKLHDGVDNTDFKIRCRRKRAVEEALCDCEECICCIDEGLDEICIGNVNRGIEIIEESIEIIEENIDELQDMLGMGNCNNNSCR
jgi:hypothetical protein